MLVTHHPERPMGAIARRTGQSVLEAIRDFPAAFGKLCHDLFMRPDIHVRRAVERARVAELLSEFLAGFQAAVESKNAGIPATFHPP